MGTALNAPKIARIIERDKLLSVKKEIGESAYLFALKRAPFLIGPVEFSFVDDRLPQNFRSNVIAYGMKCLEACFSGQPNALIKRVLFKLPKSICGSFKPEDLTQEKAKASNLMKKVLLREVGPEWAPYFS